MNGIDECARVGEVHAVMVDEVEINRAYGVVGTDESNFLGSGEVAKIKEFGICRR